MTWILEYGLNLSNSNISRKTTIQIPISNMYKENKKSNNLFTGNAKKNVAVIYPLGSGVLKLSIGADIASKSDIGNQITCK